MKSETYFKQSRFFCLTLLRNCYQTLAGVENFAFWPRSEGATVVPCDRPK
ncbi:hypothetical protein SAMN02745129_4359 [Ferrimonas marina]|uniref:Uncharacterized protein n=1 Tax=Ferrimonas marina TaxID=299255 RepID=A0A1M5YSM2_9GAMM|nr:hypothetical protein SAMN02745129_4359 [Ferrimonas marina]